MDRKKFQALADAELQRLFQAARERDELAFLFAVLGMTSGAEDAAWQPIGETQALAHDVLALINGPLTQYAKVRMSLVVYCHLIEADFIYDCLYNLLLILEGRQPPKAFNFLDKYRNGVAPGASAKIAEIKAKAIELKFSDVNVLFGQIIHPEIRDAFLRSDYLLVENELHLKHRSQIARIRLNDVIELVQMTVDWFNAFLRQLAAARRSFSKGHRIAGRKSPSGETLAAVEVLVDERGFATGFKASDSLPLW